MIFSLLFSCWILLSTFSFAIYLRLCVIMGLNWIIEGIIMLTDINATVEMVLDMCNALTGVYIFGLFVLKPSVLHLIKKRFVDIILFIWLLTIILTDFIQMASLVWLVKSKWFHYVVYKLGTTREVFCWCQTTLNDI